MCGTSFGESPSGENIVDAIRHSCASLWIAGLQRRSLRGILFQVVFRLFAPLTQEAYMVLKKLFGRRESDANSGSTSTPSADARSAAIAEPKKAGETASELQRAGAAAAPTAVAGADGANEPKIAEYLELAMVENARNDTADSRRKVYQELLFSELLLALAEPNPGASGTPEGAEAGTGTGGEEGQQMSVAILQNSAGTPFAAAFTSGAAARRWRPDGGQYVSVKGQDIFKLLEPSPAEVIVVNPGSAPFILLSKVEYRQLAMGIVPQTAQSPVQVAAGGAGPQESDGGNGGEGQMQVAFPPDVFNDEQKAHTTALLAANTNIEAAVLGAILPPNAAQDGWIRTLFLRVNGLVESAEAMQGFCTGVRNEIVESQKTLFANTPFEVGIMPDPGFWQAMHQNGIILFDKNPPIMSQPESKDGVVDAHLEA